MTPTVRVTALNVYPVKSCAGTPLQAADIGARGIVHDREFMVVDPDGHFLTQRELPRMALIQASFDGRSLSLRLRAPGAPLLQLEPRDQPRGPVSIWRDCVEAADQGQAVADWLSGFLEYPCRLVWLPPDAVRPVDPEFAMHAGDQVGFADGYPLLLISEESLADLNARLAEPLPMNRFRPSVVVRGTGPGLPYAEDGWREIRIGDVGFSLVKACARCAITTTNQATTERGLEPLATLATYRRIPRGVLFGQNMIQSGPGRISVGDEVHLVATRPAQPGQ